MFAGIIDLSDDTATRILVAIGLAVVGVVAGRLIRGVLTPRLTERRTPSFGRVVSRLIGWGVSAIAIAIAITIAFPSVKPVDVIGGLGIFSIAVGFAFQDILSNLLAGLLLIIRQPFESGDQIVVNDHTGTVEGITIRETTLRTFAGERVVIPNKDVYQSAITVNTAFDARRTNVIVGIGYGDDLEQAEDAILSAVRSIDDVADEPAPEAYLVGLGDNSVNFDVRYWTAPDQATVRRVQHLVVKAVKEALDDEGIDMPWPIRTLELGGSVVEALRPTTDTQHTGAVPTMPASQDHGPSIKDDDTYEALRDEGYSKSKAAAIANAGDEASEKGGHQPPYEDWTKDELYERAQELDVDGRSSMSKDELIDALRS